jgi:hypothetical protein
MPQVAYRAVRSRRKFNKSAQIKKALGDRMDAKVKPHFVAAFDEKVSDWSVAPEFKTRKFITLDDITLNVYPAGEGKQRWIWVSRGTKGPYKIPKAGPAFLAFSLGYSARTKPRGRAHVGTGKATGPKIVGIMQIQKHPGIEAREFEEVIAEDEKDWYSRTMENLWRQVLRSV